MTFKAKLHTNKDTSSVKPHADMTKVMCKTPHLLSFYY